MSGVFFAMLIFVGIFYPFVFKFGIEKGRIALFIGVFGIVGLAGMLSNLVNVSLPSGLLTFFENYWLLTLIIIAIIILLVSYKISEKIYMKKEF